MNHCSICNRITPEKYQEKHHLIPKSKKGKETIIVCIDCGNQIHLLFNLKELRDKYNTLEKLKSNEKIIKWITWIKKQKTFGMCFKIKKSK